MFTEWIKDKTFHAPADFERNTLITKIRGLCYRHNPRDPVWTDETGDYATILAKQIVNWGLDGVSEEEARVHREHRHHLLKEMVKKKKRLHERRELALKQLELHAHYFGGWDRLCARSTHYQLGAQRAWFKPGPVLDIMRDVREFSKDDPKHLKNLGYLQLAQAEYRVRMRDAIVAAALQDEQFDRSELVWLAHTLVLLTSRAQRWAQPTGHPDVLVKEELSICKHRVVTLIDRTTYLRVPMQLYHLARQQRVLQSVYTSCADPALLVSTDDRTWRAHESGTGVRVVDTGKKGGQQLALFFDSRIVSSKQESFLSVPLDDQGADPIASLIRTLENYPVKNKRVFEHLPRVVAGMFAAAHRDRQSGLGGEGVFWDTSTGKRICKLIGFDPSLIRHTDRVTDVRRLLEGFRLHRKFKQLDEFGRPVEVMIHNPIIEPRDKIMELTVEQREGIDPRCEFRAWSIDEHLWRSTLDTADGGTPAFMLIDERAFKLSSSVAFNIYWSLINRAYFHWRKTDRAGAIEGEDRSSFSVRLGVLYTWSGFEKHSARISRVRDQFAEAFSSMQEHGLLLSWSSDVLASKKGVDFDSFADATIQVKFPKSITQLVSSMELESGPMVLELES